RKPIVLKRIVAHAVEVPAVQSPRRSPRAAGPSLASRGCWGQKTCPESRQWCAPNSPRSPGSVQSPGPQT
ncbi:CDCA5 isoform 5, partial [Pongo abelii]